MRSLIASVCATVLLTALLIVSGSSNADDISEVDGEKWAVEVRALLEKGQTSDMLPEGMVVRINACLGELDRKESGKELPAQLNENWEFTSQQVRRLVIEEGKVERTNQRFESRPFDSKDICKDLLKGKALEIHARKGTGPKVPFSGSRYRRGSRSIEVVMNGQTILHLFETNGPFLELYAETDARAFGELYDRLATQARQKFQSKAEDVR